jgi:cephalosporin hydroxylase
MKTDLSTYSDIFLAHTGNNADKWEGYLHSYDEILTPLRERCRNFMEIGVNNGGSLEIFASFFTNALNIVGVDINNRCSEISFGDSRIEVKISDASSPELTRDLAQIYQEFDIVLDDGSHHSRDIVSTFINLVELMRPGGTYIIEDLCCSYWEEYGGGLKSTKSAIEFFKLLTDLVNHEHWESDLSIEQLLSSWGNLRYQSHTIGKLASIRSISFYNSICVIRFAELSSQRLIGRRLCRGTLVSAGYEPMNGQDIKEIRRRNSS